MTKTHKPAIRAASRKAKARNASARYTRVTRSGRGEGRLLDPNSTLVRRARRLLKNAFAELRSWARVGERFGVNRGAAYYMARGERPVSEHMRRLAWLACKRNVRRFVRRVVVPFLAHRQPSGDGRYTRGSKHA